MVKFKVNPNCLIYFDLGVLHRKRFVHRKSLNLDVSELLQACFVVCGKHKKISVSLWKYIVKTQDSRFLKRCF